MSMQAMLFARPIAGRPSYPQGFDAIWAIPQVVASSGPFWSVLHRCPVRPVPFIWDPRWLDARAQAMPNQGLRSARSGPLRVTVSEPNHDVVKFGLYPLMIAELVWRRHPELIELVSVTNTDNDVAGITVNPTAGLTTAEAGGTATFTVVLNTQPTGNVTIGLTTNDLTEGTVSPDRKSTRRNSSH